MNLFKNIFKKTLAEPNHPAATAQPEQVPVPEKDTRTKDFLKSVTVIKNEQGFQAAVQALIFYLESNKLSLENQVKVIKKMFPYIENKKSGFDNQSKEQIYNKYVVDYLEHKQTKTQQKVDLLKGYNNFLKSIKTAPEDIYQLDMSYFKDKASLDYISSFTSIAALVSDIQQEFRLKFYTEHFEPAVAVMDSIGNVDGYKIRIYENYIDELIENNEFDKAFVMCRRTGQEILYKKNISQEIFFNEGDAFYRLYFNQATICYKQKINQECIYFLLHCVLIQYMSRNFSTYTHLKWAEQQHKKYESPYNAQEYWDRINSYTIKSVVDWMDEYSPIKFTDLISELKLDSGKVIGGLQQYAEKKLFKIYHDKLIWMADMSNSINKIISESKS